MHIHYTCIFTILYTWRYDLIISTTALIQKYINSNLPADACLNTQLLQRRQFDVDILATSSSCTVVSILSQFKTSKNFGFGWTLSESFCWPVPECSRGDGNLAIKDLINRNYSITRRLIHWSLWNQPQFMECTTSQFYARNVTEGNFCLDFRSLYVVDSRMNFRK